MAEGLARKLGEGKIEVHSAGIRPKGIHSMAIAAMDQIHIDIRNQISKPIDPALLNQMDIVITVCAHAEVQCPAVPPHIRRDHWPILDPAQAGETDSERFKYFCLTRDHLKEKILDLLAKISSY